MPDTTITSNIAVGYVLGSNNPVTISPNVTISNADKADRPAISSQAPTYWNIINYGSLLATTANAASDGVLLAGGGGAITNMTSGLITGNDVGVSVAGAGTVVNKGSIATTNTVGAGFTYVSAFTATTAGVLVQGGGVYNAGSGMIASYLEGVVVNGGGSVVNAGTISATSQQHGFGIVLPAGGSVTNTSGATIDAGEDGILTWADPATVTNQGSVLARDNVGVVLLGSGLLNNASSGEIRGFYEGVYTYAPASTVVNSGTLFGYANAGALLHAQGSVTNTGTGSISGYKFGIQFSDGIGSVLNTGTISDQAVFNQTNTFQAAGVQLAQGGVVTNATGGIITSKWIGVQIGQSATASVGGTVINQGTIVAADSSGDGAGIWLHGPGAITNAPGGLISGGAFGIVAYYQATLVNQGTISATEYAFASKPGFANRVVDTPGGIFHGAVDGGNTLGSAVYSTLELASGSSIGTITNIGTFTDFGRIALDAGVTWSVGGSIVAGQTIAFGGADAALILNNPSADAGTITGFTATDTIALSGITDVRDLSFNGGNTLTVTESDGSALTVRFATPIDLTYAKMGASTDISAIPCFLPGTHILTNQGEVLVEKLQVGDAIVTRSGQTRRLCWIGQGRTLATRGRRNAATPVIVRKGALADNRPHLDLHITKGHSLFLDDVLIPVEFLVNHRSIVWDDRAQEVTVFHLELDAHDVLIANGVAAESYRDDGNRWLFQNANAGWDQPPKVQCAPVLTGGPIVDAAWRRLLDRAGPRPGVPLTDDPDLHLLVDGQRVDAHDTQGLIYIFRLPQVPKHICIASREAVPAEIGLARDPRSLGIALRRVAIRQETKFVALTADDVRLVDGFYAYEAVVDLRWTNGAATLPVEFLAQFQGGIEVLLHLAATTRYPASGGHTAQTAA